MCMIELEPCEVWVEKTLRARKDHQCSACQGHIGKGQSYSTHFSVFEGDATYEKICAACFVDRKEFGAAHGMLCTPGSFENFLRDCIADGDEESERKWKPMLERLEARKAAKP